MQAAPNRVQRQGQATGESADTEVLNAAVALLEWEKDEATSSRGVEIDLVDAKFTLGERADAPSDVVGLIDHELWRRRLELNTASLLDIGIDAATIQQRILPSIPQLARLNTEEVVAMIHGLTSFLGGPEQAAAAMIEEPLLLGYTVKEHLEPGIQFLVVINAMADEAAAGKLAADNPALLKWAIDGSIKERRMSGLLSGLKGSAEGAVVGTGRAISELTNTRRRTGL